MTIAYEFPDFDLASLPQIPSSWIDVSWHNDCCPSWQVTANLVVFVDYADPQEREINGKRYAVNDIETCQCLFQSDSWNDVLAFIKA